MNYWIEESISFSSYLLARALWVPGIKINKKKLKYKKECINFSNKAFLQALICCSNTTWSWISFCLPLRDAFLFSWLHSQAASLQADSEEVATLGSLYFLPRWKMYFFLNNSPKWCQVACIPSPPLSTSLCEEHGISGCLSWMIRTPLSLKVGSIQFHQTTWTEADEIGSVVTQERKWVLYKITDGHPGWKC